VFSRCFEPLYLKNCWTYQNEHGGIRSSSAPFFPFFEAFPFIFFFIFPAILYIFNNSSLTVYFCLSLKDFMFLLFLYFSSNILYFSLCYFRLVFFSFFGVFYIFLDFSLAPYFFRPVNANEWIYLVNSSAYILVFSNIVFIAY